MRDRETDSWWSIMSSDSIGGPLDGAQLSELPVSEKAVWADWVARYPHTLILSVDGSEHIDTNPYDNYFSSDGTFRDLEIHDTRLEPKESIYSFWIDGKPYAAPFGAFEGGRIFRLDDGRSILLARPANSPIFLSSQGYLVNLKVIANLGADQILARIDELAGAVTPLEGFDTYWYTWVSVNADTEVLGESEEGLGALRSEAASGSEAGRAR
jgi:hypothetical protein